MDEDRASAPPDTPLTRAAPLLWAIVALSLAALVSVATLAVLAAERGPRPPFLTEPLAPLPLATPAPAPSTALDVAGSGSNLPLTRALVEAFRRERPGVRVVVHESIGSTGGARAVRDGAVGLGLISRALTADEARLGLVVTPYARVPVVVAANPSVPDRCVTSADLVALWSGARARWSDGSRAVVLLRERGDSSFLAVAQRAPALLAENEAAYRADRFRVLYHDRAMQDALVATEGAVGIFDLGAIEAQRLPLQVLCLDGAVPSREGVASGRYPYWKDLAFVTLGPPHGIAADLIRFVASPAGRELEERLGYVALPGGAP